MIGDKYNSFLNEKRIGSIEEVTAKLNREFYHRIGFLPCLGMFLIDKLVQANISAISLLRDNYDMNHQRKIHDLNEEDDAKIIIKI